MAELDPHTWELDGGDLLEAGFAVLDTDGLEDSANLELEQADLPGDGVHFGRQRVTTRQITLTLGHNEDSDDDAIAVLRQQTGPLANRVASHTARFRHREEDITWTFRYVPAPGKPLSIPGDPDWIERGFSKAIQVRLLTGPYLYADTADTQNYTAGQTHTITNDGTVAAQAVTPGFGAMTWTISTAGGCVNPYVRHEDFDEAWVLPLHVTAGQTVTVDASRVTRVNGTVRHKVEGPDGCPVAVWPVLRPGDNEITMGAETGGFTAVLTTRSTR